MRKLRDQTACSPTLPFPGKNKDLTDVGFVEGHTVHQCYNKGYNQHLHVFRTVSAFLNTTLMS